MKDINDFRFTGTVEQFKRIPTKTGTPMISFMVICWKEKIRTVAFKDLATDTELAPGSRIEVKGSIQSTSWTDQNGQQRHGWQVVAHSIEIVNDNVDRQQEARPARQQQDRPHTAKQQQDSNSQFAYHGGPF